MKNIIMCIFAVLLFSGCETLYDTPSTTGGTGIEGDIIHSSTIMTEIISDPPGAKIEINSQYVGETPLTTHITRVNPGYGWNMLTITAYPIYEGQEVQRKVVGINEPTPTKVYFDMNLVRIPRE
jgi:hypothetical protein